MDFLHIGLLPYFLPLAAIPIILHLLTLHRLRTVELSTFRFLFDSYVQQRRRMKFLEALIAALRTLFLLFLVLSIARPVVKHWEALFGGSGTGRDVVLLVDGSASMGAITDGVTAMERAKQAALKVVGRLGGDDRVTVFRVASKPEEICNRFSSDAEAIRGEIESLTVSPSRANLFAAFSHLFGPESRELTNPLIYLFSDLQSSGWSEFDDDQSDHLVPADTELIVVNVGSNRELANRAIIGGAPSQERAIVGLPITLRPHVANYSESESQDVALSVFVDEKEIARKNLTLKPGETREAEVVFTPSEPGVLRGRYEIPSDRFTDDDSFLFALTVSPQVKVLLVNGNPAAEPLENEGLYLRTAMVATDAEVGLNGESDEDHSDADLAAKSDFIRALDVQDVPEGNLNAETLLDADVVILANCGGLKAPEQFNLLCDFVAGGGGLLICPGDKVDPNVYNQHFLPAPNAPDRQLVSVRLGATEGDPDDVDTFERLGAIDFAHPIFSVFADSDQRYLTKVSVYRRFPLELPPERGNSWPLAELSSGNPAIVESRFGNGRVLLSAFPLNTRWGNLPLKPEFVPLVLRMIGHVKRRADLEGPSVVSADGPAEFIVSQSWAPASGKVTDIAGRVTPLTFQRSNSQLMGAFERTTEKGYYTVEVSGGRTEEPKNGTLSFAVNLAPGESDFAALTDPQISDILPGAKLTVVDASAEAQQLYGGVGHQREIWQPLILLMFVIIGVEFLLSTLGGHVADKEEPQTTSERIRDLAQGAWVGRMTGGEIGEMAESNTAD